MKPKSHSRGSKMSHTSLLNDAHKPKKDTLKIHSFSVSSIDTLFQKIKIKIASKDQQSTMAVYCKEMNVK